MRQRVSSYSSILSTTKPAKQSRCPLPRCYRFNTLLAAPKSKTTLFSLSITDIANYDLALRLHLLKIFSGFYGYLFPISIRARFTIYSYLETSTDVLLNHLPPI
jgi:hypothetical protein